MENQNFLPRHTIENCLHNRVKTNTSILFPVFDYSVGWGTQWFTVSCPIGYNLLSCGNDDNTSGEDYRRSRPVSSKDCQCYDYYGMYCVAWCTTMPVPSFEIARGNAGGLFSVNCPTGKQAMGCHISTTSSRHESWRRHFPDKSGKFCTCYDYYGTDCLVTCNTLTNYEVISAYGVGNTDVSCTDPINRVLGCGIDPDGSPWGDRSRTVRVINGNTCRCNDRSGTKCFAICGRFW